MINIFQYRVFTGWIIAQLTFFFNAFTDEIIFCRGVTYLVERFYKHVFLN